MNKFNLKYFFSKHHKKSVCMNPHKHWVLMLYSFFGILLILVISSFYLLYEIKNDNFLNKSLEFSSKNTLISRNEKLLNNVKSYFDIKAKKMESLQNDGLSLEDPRFKK